MNAVEYHQWLKYHQGRFPTIAEKLTPELQDAICELLGGTRLEDAKAATDQLFAAGKNTYLHALGATIRTMAWLIREQREEEASRAFAARTGEQGYKCGHCADTGQVTILVSSLPSQHERIAATYGEERAARETVTAGCICEYGTRTGIRVRYRPGVHQLPQLAEPDPSDEVAMRYWERLERAIMEARGH